MFTLLKWKIRRALITDIPNLTAFFQKSYGSASIFSDPLFLKQYFQSSNPDFLNAFIAVKESEILSNYGMREQLFLYDGNCINIAWGVNAFSLPEFRGQGLGDALVDAFCDEYPFAGVIGFHRKTADYYRKRNFELFGCERFVRWFIPFNLNKTLKIIAAVEGNIECINEMIRCQNIPIFTEDPAKIKILDLKQQASNKITRTLKTMGEQQGLLKAIRFSAVRNLETLKERFFSAYHPKYEFFVPFDVEQQPAYIVVRRETIGAGDTISRIIDLYGNPNRVLPLLAGVTQLCRTRNDVYLEFACWGSSLFDACFNENGFFCLKEDRAAWLPMVSSPLQKRSNNEYFGISSKSENFSFSNFKSEHIFLTRSASDRDRLNQRT